MKQGKGDQSSSGTQPCSGAPSSSRILMSPCPISSSMRVSSGCLSSHLALRLTSSRCSCSSASTSRSTPYSSKLPPLPTATSFLSTPPNFLSSTSRSPQNFALQSTPVVSWTVWKSCSGRRMERAASWKWDLLRAQLVRWAAGSRREAGERQQGRQQTRPQNLRWQCSCGRRLPERSSQRRMSNLRRERGGAGERKGRSMYFWARRCVCLRMAGREEESEMPTPFELVLFLVIQMFSSPITEQFGRKWFSEKYRSMSRSSRIVSSSEGESQRCSCSSSSSRASPSQSQPLPTRVSSKTMQSRRTFSSFWARGEGQSGEAKDAEINSSICFLSPVEDSAEGGSSNSNLLSSFLSLQMNQHLMNSSSKACFSLAKSQVRGCSPDRACLANILCSPAFDVTRSE